MRMREKILVAGGGIAGLGAALALGGGTRDVTILDRDPPPPEGSSEEAFYNWERKGATQLRHSHAFLGRLTTLIRERYPDLMAELLREGTRLFGFEDGLPPPLASSYVPVPGDEDLQASLQPPHDAGTGHAALCGQASRRHLRQRRRRARSDHATRERQARRRRPEGRAQRRRRRHARRRRGRCIGPQHVLSRLAARRRRRRCTKNRVPAAFSISRATTSCATDRTNRRATVRRAARDLGYIKFGVFIADNRHFSVTLATPEIETEMRHGRDEAGEFRRHLHGAARRRALDRIPSAPSR